MAANKIALRSDRKEAQMRLTQALWIFVVALLSTVAIADPNPEIRRLMNEPASMLDLGMDRLNDLLSQTSDSRMNLLSVTEPHGADSVSVSYDFAANAIEVWELVPPAAQFSAQPKGLCRDLISTLRTDLGYPEGSSIHFATWTSMFVHNGYTLSSKLDSALSESLPKLVRIKASIWDKEAKKFVLCYGPLTAKTVAFEE